MDGSSCEKEQAALGHRVKGEHVEVSQGVSAIREPAEKPTAKDGNVSLFLGFLTGTTLSRASNSRIFSMRMWMGIKIPQSRFGERDGYHIPALQDPCKYTITKLSLLLLLLFVILHYIFINFKK